MIKRNYAVDYLKCAAIILILITHSISDATRQLILGPFWIAMAVPVFMIISGFNFTASCERRKILSIRAWFTKENIIPKLKRILVPYTIVYILEILIIAISGKTKAGGGVQ